MVTECPKCQTTLTFEFQDLESGSEVGCKHCDARLKIKVVPEIIFDPVSPLISSRTPEYPQEDPPSDSKGSILLCIDGEATREVMKALLETLHYFVIDIPSGGPAFTRMKQNPPALAFVDNGLSDMPGAQLCQKIKQSPDLKNTIVILVGSMFEKNTKYRREAPDWADADDYIDRHEIHKNLLTKVEQHLSKEEEQEEKDRQLEPASPNTFETPDEAVSENQHAKKLSSEETEHAKRFAETVVSDIVKFNDRKVEEGLRDGDFYEILADEIKEGREVYQTRVSQDFWSLGYYEQALEKFIRESGQSTGEEITPPFERSTPIFEKKGGFAAEEELDESSYLVKGARRLAKIIVSDIVIYNESKVEEGLEKNKFYELLENEISEGRQLYESRVDKSLYHAGIYEQALEAFIEGRNTQDFPNDEKPTAVFERVVKPEQEDKIETAIEADPGNHPIDSSENKDEEEPLLEKSPETLEKARQIAEDIISDILEAHPEKVEEGLKNGTLLETLNDEFMMGRLQFEEKAPTYFDSSLFEDIIDDFIASKTEKENQTPISKGEEPLLKTTDEEDSPAEGNDPWQSTEMLEAEAPQDIFQEMENQAQEIAQEPEPSLEDSAWESPETIETEAPQDIFQEMENQAQEIAQEPEPVPEESAWESPVTPETEAPQDVFQEMENQAQEIAQEPEPVPEESAWESPVTPETEAPQDVFQKMESQAQEVVREPEPALKIPPETTPDEVDSEETKNAKRLAKIIVSDIVIYNEDKVEKGLQNNTFYEILEDDIREGRVLFESRVSQTLFEAGLYENALEDFINSRNGTQNQSTSDLSHEATAVHQKLEPTDKNGSDVIEETKEEKDAKRLANIIVSDIMIYNEKKVEKGLQNGTFYEILEDDIREGTALYESRVSPKILAEKDYLKVALADFLSKRTASLS